MPDPEGNKLPLILICGQTAVGKTAVAIELARLINAEIISVDSMQVYRGMDIGTAKPTIEERLSVPHHLIDILEITASFNAADFVKLANEAILNITARGKNVIMCGGTGLYFKAFLKGLGQTPPPDKELRKELEATPFELLLNELKEKDPITYSKIDRNNPRRVVRAIEVIRTTGKPISQLRADWNQTSFQSPFILFALKRDSADLRKRINDRVDLMFKQGLVYETQKLLKLGLEQNPTAMQAIGYKQVVEYLRGERSYEETVNLVKIRTWQFARRQMTWFKYQLPTNWIKIEADETAQQIAKKLLSYIQPKNLPQNTENKPYY
ncbi:MAG: tRNA (adenosine(37)-N6)-dimethylallyltransferase MiaA [Verrucomicrobiia bacterium]|jgi:tRNA dimethylallyltransferase